MIDGIPLVDVGQAGLITFFVLLVLTDRLVWHKRLDKLEKQLEAKDAQLVEVTAQNSLLMKSAIPTVNSVLTALHTAAEEKS